MYYVSTIHSTKILGIRHIFYKHWLYCALIKTRFDSSISTNIPFEWFSMPHIFPPSSSKYSLPPQQICPTIFSFFYINLFRDKVFIIENNFSSQFPIFWSATVLSVFLCILNSRDWQRGFANNDSRTLYCFCYIPVYVSPIEESQANPVTISLLVCTPLLFLSGIPFSPYLVVLNYLFI